MARALPFVLALPLVLLGCETFDVALDVVVADGQGALDSLDHLALTTDYGDGRAYTFVTADPTTGAWSLGEVPPGDVRLILEGRVDDPVTAGNSLVVSEGRVGPVAIGPDTQVERDGARVLFTRRNAMGLLHDALDDGLQHHAIAPLPGGGAVSFGGRGADEEDGTRKILRFDTDGTIDSLVFREVASMSAPRRDHAAVPLADGRVLITGTLPLYDPRGGAQVLINQGSGSALEEAREAAAPEIYDPLDDSLTALVEPDFDDELDDIFVRGRHTTTLLDDGRVFLAGGVQFDDNGGLGIYFPGDTLLIDPDGGYALGPNVGANRFAHTATKLADGRVLIVGGRGVTGGSLRDQESTELFDPSDDTSTFAGALEPPRGEHGAALLPDGRVIVFGGSTSDGTVALDAAAFFDPETLTWSDGPALNVARWNPAVATGPGGAVVVCGGANEAGPVPGCEVFVPGPGEGWAPAPDPGGVSDLRDGAKLVTLGSGDVLGVGGITDAAPNLEVLLFRP